MPVSTAQFVKYMKYIHQALFNIFRKISDFETLSLVITNYQTRGIAAIQHNKEWPMNPWEKNYFSKTK